MKLFVIFSLVYWILNIIFSAVLFIGAAVNDGAAGVFGAICKFIASIIFIFLAIIALLWG